MRYSIVMIFIAVLLGMMVSLLRDEEGLRVSGSFCICEWNCRDWKIENVVDGAKICTRRG